MKNIVLAILALVSFSAFAENIVFEERPSAFKYNYVEGQLRFFDSEAVGPKVKLSFDVHSNFSVIGSLGYYQIDKKNLDATYLQLSAGAAYHANVGEMFDFEPLNKMDAVIYAELEYWDAETKSETTVCAAFVGCITSKSKASDDDIGIRHGAEVRYGVLDNVEAYVDVSLRTTADVDVIVGSGVRFAVMEQLKLTAGFELADDENISLGVRYSF